MTALLFARSGLYAERAQRPGLPRIVSSLFQVTRRRADLRARQRRAVLELLHLLRHALLRDRLRVDASRWALREGHRACCCARPATGAARCSSARASTSRTSHHALRRRGARAGRDARLHLAHAAARQRAALARADRGAAARCSTTTACRRSSSPTRTSRRSARSSSSTSATGAASPCASRRRRWRSSSTAPSSCPGASVPLFELRPPVFDGFDYLLKRAFDFVGALLLLLAAQPAADRDRASRCSSPRAARCSTARSGPGIGGEPFACFKFRTMRSDADQLQADLESLNEASGALFKIRRRPAHDARRAASCAATRSTSCRSCSTCVRGPDVARRAAAAAAARLRPARGLAQEALPRAARHDRPVAGLRAAPSSTSTTSCGSTSSTSSAGRSGSTSRSCSRRSPRCSAAAARSSACWRSSGTASRPGTPSGGSRGSSTRRCREVGRAQARALAPLVARLAIPPGASSAPTSRGRARPPSCSGCARAASTRRGGRSTSARGRGRTAAEVDAEGDGLTNWRGGARTAPDGETWEAFAARVARRARRRCSPTAGRARRLPRRLHPRGVARTSPAATRSRSAPAEREPDADRAAAPAPRLLALRRHAGRRAGRPVDGG